MNLRTDFKYCFKDKVSMYWSYECYYQMAISGCQVNPFTARKTCQVVKAWKLSLLIISLLLPFSSSKFWLLPNYSLQSYQNVFHFYLTWSWWKNTWTNSAINAAILCQRSYVDVLLPQVLSRPKWFPRKLSLKWELTFLLQKTFISSYMVSPSESSELSPALELSWVSYVFHISFL